MKKIIFSLIGLFFMFGEVSASDFKYRQQYVNCWGSVGGSYLNYSTNKLTSSRLGAAVGVGYTWKWENELFLTLGAEANYLSSNMFKIDEVQITRRMKDHDMAGNYNDFTMYTDFEKLKEWDDMLLLNFNPMLGYKFKKGFFISVGAKVGYSLMSTAHLSTFITNTAKYDNLEGVFSDMPEYYLVTDKKIKKESKLESSINAAASLEFGRELKLKSLARTDNLLRLSAVVDYGFLNMNNNPNVESTAVLPMDNPADFILTPIMATQDYGNDAMTPLYVGVKLSYYYCTKKLCSCLKHQGLANKKKKKRK